MKLDMSTHPSRIVPPMGNAGPMADARATQKVALTMTVTPVYGNGKTPYDQLTWLTHSSRALHPLPSGLEITNEHGDTHGQAHLVHDL